MSERFLKHCGACMVAAMLLAVAGPRAATAQELSRIGERLLAASRATSDARDSMNAIIDKVRHEAVPADSIKAGELIIRYNAGNVGASSHAVIARAAVRAWERIQHGLGDAAPRVARLEPLVVTTREYQGRFAPHVINFGIPGAPARGRAFTLPISEAEAEDAIVDLIGTVASFDEPSSLKGYLGEWVPAAGLSAADWSNAAIDMATANSSAVRDCFAGSIARCKSALGLIELADPLTEWYSPEDWRVIISRRGIVDRSESREHRELVERCLAGGAPDVCEALVRERPIVRPLDVASRRTALGLALELGGAKAFDRMAATKGDAAQILAATAGAGIDDVIAQWRARVLASSPERVRPRVLEATTMIAWVLVFAFAASRRRP